MGRVRVIINNKMPSADVMSRYRNFDSIMQRYKMYYRTDGIRYMLYHQRRKLVYIILILIFLLLLLFADDIHAHPLATHYINHLPLYPGPAAEGISG